jgi:signal transduction histidine kinase
MPPAPPVANVLLQRRALLAAAGVSLVLAVSLVIPLIAHCSMGDDYGERCLPSHEVGAIAWLALMLWALWVGAAVSQRWLPSSPRAHRWGLAVQIAGLTAAVMVTVPLIIGLTDDAFSLYSWQVKATLAAGACLAVDYYQRGQRGEAAAETLRRNEQGLAAQLDAARAALLQAQVEPHFLFNTLAHLRRLAATDPAEARAMLADLRRYLAAALPELRQSETPLVRELDLVRAFLALHQRRIGPERLALSFDVAPGLDDIVVPSTCLLTLAENAIKHGIAPRVEGGEIRVSAGPDPEQPGLLRLEVADTGAGMTAATGSGTGLATLRARLAAVHGDAARLSLHLNQPSGLIARVSLPWR